MDNAAPIPKPRTNNATQKLVFGNEGSCCKKPIPLPRTTKTCKTNYCNTSTSNNLGTVCDEINSHINSPSHENNRMSCSRRSLRSMREEWKASLEDAHLRGKCLVENTKQASSRLEKSVRNMLGRRMTIRSSPERDENNSVKATRSVSLPAEDIFHSISFHSPLNAEIKAEEIPVVYEDAVKEDCKATSGAPPPVYPPPPLPDESVYDEVGQHSAISSQSSNCDTYSEQGSDTIYEDVLIARNVKLRNSLQSESSLSDYLSFNDNVITSESESWSYISGTIPNEELYRNLSVTGSSDSDGNDLLPVNKMENEDCVKARNINKLSRNESSDNSELRISDLSSMSIKNDLYENWEISIPAANLPKQVDIGRNVLTKSVILEFDPLFEVSHDTDEADVNYEFLLQDGDSVNPYGKIKRVVKDDQAEKCDESDYIPVPPERYDSLNFHTDTESLERPVDVPVIADDATVSQEPVQNVTRTNKDSVDRNQKTSIKRWMSMKRAIQSMTDRRMSKEPRELSAVNSQNSVFYEVKSESSTSIKRPNLMSHLPVHYSGVLYRCDRLRNFVQWHCVLTDGQLTCSSEKFGSGVSDVLPLDKILSIQLVPEHKVG
ncbi:hypothetical protein L9F63_004459 [Diploptera punctata]|uniref:Uncharacterized protein n=1 Tax=Diploptera punctata TaxID=6984 RepID=A0AAD7ZGT5_DIPPU|nr:hypothetical protein L9F63_004459 [Diploptera punctata]